MSNLDRIIIGILGISSLVTVVKILLASFSMPRKGWLGDFIYGQDKIVVKETLAELGIDTKEIADKLVKRKGKGGIEKIIDVCIENIEYSGDESYFGSNASKHKSRYYIHTMDAVHNKEHLDIMSDGIRDLLGKCKDSPRFIITPKVGNVCLAFNLFNIGAVQFVILYKSEADPSNLQGSSEYARHSKYEGLTAILDYVNKHPRETLYGIIVDCNRAGCNTIKSMARDFNNVISEEPFKGRVAPINEAVLLFRPIDNSSVDIDSDKTGICIHRYFDLNEAAKEEMWKIKEWKNSKDYTTYSYKEKKSHLKNRLSDEKLLKV
jgi:hypothetical protein